MRWVILHGYSPPVNHSHLKGSRKGNTDYQRGGEREGWKGRKEGVVMFIDNILAESQFRVISLFYI